MGFISHRKSYVCHKYIQKSHVHTHMYLYICSHIHVHIQAKILQAQTHSVNGARYLKESSPTENNNKLPAELITEVGECAAWDRTGHKTKGLAAVVRLQPALQAPCVLYLRQLQVWVSVVQ